MDAVQLSYRSNTMVLLVLGLLALRIVNALTISTLFQPDEYFQSLEPAWQAAFGDDSGAWITWVSSMDRTVGKRSNELSRSGGIIFGPLCTLCFSRQSINQQHSSVTCFT